MKNRILIYLALLLAAPLLALGQFHTEVEDTSPAIRIYNDTGETVTFVIATNGADNDLAFTIGSTTNTIDGSGASVDTIVELAAAIAATTNSSGTAFTSIGEWAVDADCSLAADSTDGELLNETMTVLDNAWGEFHWDTSTSKFFSVYIPDHYNYNQVVQPYRIVGILGSLAGTTNATTAVYLNGTKVWQQVDAASAGTVDLNAEPAGGIPVGPNQAVIVRSTYDTTATTGVLGVNTTAR